MTAAYKDLFWKAKNRAKETGHKYVWFKRGKLYVRKDQGDRVNRISVEEDISTYIK